MADNDHGKSTIVRSFVAQGFARDIGFQRKSRKVLTSPSGRDIDSYIFGRSYQEVERAQHGSVKATLYANDPDWTKRELIVLPSHVAPNDLSDVKDMIQLAHRHGFDAIAVPVVLEGENYSNRSSFPKFMDLPWDERWTIPNTEIISDDPKKLPGHLDALGRDLFFWVCATLVK